MRRVLTVILILAILCFSFPAHSSISLLDLPAGHWAYEALETLASCGIISGYDGGTFRGDRPMTRYEAASFVARAIAYMDKNKADKNMLDLVKRMCVELKDELDALGVDLSAVEENIGILNSRLGGWQINGTLNLDVNALPSTEATTGNKVLLSRSRLNISRVFGENDSMTFYSQIDGTNVADGDKPLEFRKFYVDMSLGNDWNLSVGRFSKNYEAGGNMYYAAGRFADYANGTWFTDADRDSIAITKNFSLGYFGMYLAGRDRYDEADSSYNITGILALQPSEKFGIDFGFDHQNVSNDNSVLDNITTFWIAPKYNFTRDISLKGAFYAQFNGYNDSTDVANENPKAWRVILDVKQSLLKYTGLWLEYDKFDQNFILLRGAMSLLLSDNDYRNFFQTSNLGAALSVWRIGMNQEWNKRWSSWLYYSKFNFGDYPTIEGTTVNPKMEEISAGVEYRMSSSTYFSLGYFYHKFNEDAGLEKQRALIFRTSVSF